MLSYRLILTTLSLGLGALSFAQNGSVTVTADGGYVAAKNSSSGDWSGLQGTAGTATIQYGKGANSTTQLKFANSGASTASFGNTSTNGGTTTQTSGHSNISNGQGNPTTSYSAEWNSTSSAPGTQPIVAGTGTYDPWTVTYGDIHQAGVYSDLGTESFYYQSSLIDGLFDLRPGQSGAYNYVLGVAGYKFVDLTVHSAGNVDLAFKNDTSDFAIYLLNPKLVYGPEETIDYRIANGTLLTRANGASTIGDFLSRYLDPDGSLDYRLTFAIVYSGVKLPAYDPSKDGTVVVEWNTDTASPVPEPGTFAALGLGALALLRRKRR